jgi:hypothetical protein
MTARARLPNRRQSETLDFDHGGHEFTLSLSRFQDGRTAEIFISSACPGLSDRGHCPRRGNHSEPRAAMIE